MSWSTLIMYGVAAVSLLLGLFVATRPATTEPGVYRRRITAAMLLALSLILAVFATTFRLASPNS